jgi:RimJ/RimL family protein N-acetyltransferase
VAQRGRDPLLGAGPRRRDRAGAAPGRGGVGIGDWPRAAPLRTERLELEPLRVEHAHELFSLLDDPELHRFIGGRPDALAELTERLRRQAAGASPDGSQGWLNWVLRSDGAVVGRVQATLTGSTAELAWVVGTAHQGRGYATEAGLAVAEWLGTQGVTTLVAHIHPDHAASAGVARRLGLVATDARQDGEVRWVSTPK